MNLSVYIFGNLGNGYAQYPNDYTHTVFSTFYQNSKAITQIAIHRENQLMYYGYIRKLEANSYIGLCAVINGKNITKIDRLFEVYENIIESMVKNGYLIHFNDKGDIVSNVSKLYEKKEEIESITLRLQVAFEKMESSSQILPAVSYGTAKDSIHSFSIQDKNEDIIKSSYTNGYTFIYKSKDYNTTHINSYMGVILKKNKEFSVLQKEYTDLRNKYIELQHKQQNTVWVSFFALVAICFGIIVWTKVLFPSEVTKKDMGEYVYYGPMQDGEPNGTGIAIYHSNDKDGRLYYYGNFTNGKRVDENAIMFYKNGSYYRGSMNGDNWNKGLLFDIDNAHFVGEFKENAPWNGDWYKHEKVQTIRNGE